jgi:holliday junction DNA helicase RuvB
MFKKLIEVGAKILDILDNTYVRPVAMNSNNECSWDGTVINAFKTPAHKKDNIFHGIVGYSDIKKEFVKALDSSNPVSILLCGPPGCGKSEFLIRIRNHFEDESVFIDGSYGSKAGIFQILYDKGPKYALLDEIDKLSSPDQLALLNLMENGKLTKTTKSESYEIDLKAWVFATANNEAKILDPLLDRFEAYYLTDYTDDQFRAIAVKRLKQEGIENDEIALFIANAVLRDLGRKSVRDAIRIARKSNTIQDVEETIQTIKKYDLK